MIECIGYERVNNLYFNDSPEKAIEVFGEPTQKSKSETYTLKFYYDISNKDDYDFQIIFENNEFSEFILYPHTEATINGIKIGWDLKDILNIIKIDTNPRMDNYDIILYDLGISFGDFKKIGNYDNRTINLFKKGELDEFKDDTQPFNKNLYLEE